MKGSTKKKIRRGVICVVAFIAVYIAFYVKGIAQLLAGASLVVFWVALASAALMAVFIVLLLCWEYLNPNLNKPEEPEKPLSPELTELAEKLRKKLE